MASATPALQLTRRDGELLRILASVSVVSAHCIHFWVVQFSLSGEYFSLGALASLLDQFTRFTLPVFFFLSGFGLTLQTMDRPRGLKDYYRSRLFKIAAPFILWSAITSFRHILWFEALDWDHRPWHSVGAILRFLFVDGFDYQYYFLIVIFQFYLVFPFIYRLAKSKWAAFAALILHLGLTSPTETFLEWQGIQVPPMHANFLALNFFWCFMGMHLAWNREPLARWAGHWSRRGAFLLLGFSFALINAEFFLNLAGGKSLAHSDHFNRWTVVIYSLALLLVFLKSKDWLARRVIHNPRWEFLFTHIAPYTFFVYLAHTHLLRFVDYLYNENGFSDMVWRVFAVTAGSYLLAWTMHWLLEEFPVMRYFLGLPKKPLRLQDFPLARQFKAPFAAARNLGREPVDSALYSREEA